MLLCKNKSYTIQELKEAYLAPDNSAERESLYEYEMWLHDSGNWKDTYDRSNLREASKLHQMNIINGMLFQDIWYQTRGLNYCLEEIQYSYYIQLNLTSEQKNQPDFINTITHKTVELKYSDKERFNYEGYYLTYTKNSLPVHPEKMHNADTIIYCEDKDNILTEVVCIRKGDKYLVTKIKYNSKSDADIKKLYDIYNQEKVF